MFEKIVNSKAYEVINKIVNIFWLNILMLATTILGLFFFTFGAALMAGTYVIKLLSEKYEGPILPVYIKAFKKFYKKSTLISLIYIVFLLLIAYNIYFFIELITVDFSWFGYISFIVMLLAFIIGFIAMIHSLLISTCFPKSANFTIIKSGIKLTFAFTLKGLIFFFLTLALIALTYLIPILSFLISFYILGILIEYVLFKAYDKVNIFSNISSNVANELLL